MPKQLPPSKFGAGTTYGEPGQPHSLRQTPAAPSPLPAASASYPPAADPYGQAATYQAPTRDPYTSAASPQFVGPTSYSTPVAAGVPPMATAATSSSGSGAAITAAILSLIGAVWYGIVAVRDWEAMTYIFGSLGELSRLGVDASLNGWVYATIATMIAQGASVPLLFFGGILLLNRASAGRVMVVLGSVLVIAINVFGAIAAFNTIGWISQFASGLGIDSQLNGKFAALVLLNLGLPAALALIVLVLAMSGSAKRWCQRVTGYLASPTY